MPRQIQEIVARRTDLGTFLVHLTRGDTPDAARANLESILAQDKIEARTPFGAATQKLLVAGQPTTTQRCVCFTETPLEHTHLLLGDIEGRAIEFAPYGIAFPKKVGRTRGVNPVWYVDITPGHPWLMNPINTLIDAAIGSGTFPGSPIESIAPFIEQMGTRPGNPGPGYRKEFWWEREWRHAGDFGLPHRTIVLCPEDEIPHFTAHLDAQFAGTRASFVDPRWGLEQIIARLAKFAPTDTDIL